MIAGKFARNFLDIDLANPYNYSCPSEKGGEKSSEIARKIEPNRLDKAKRIPYNHKACGNGLEISSPTGYKKATNAQRRGNNRIA